VRTEEEIQQEINRVRKIKFQAFSLGNWQSGNELNSWIGALKWVLNEGKKDDDR